MVNLLFFVVSVNVAGKDKIVLRFVDFYSGQIDLRVDRNVTSGLIKFTCFRLSSRCLDYNFALRCY
jgi:hypothetical protein